MLFSVVVPVYNVEQYLEECLNSIIIQIQKYNIDAEIVLLDDGSRDNSGVICDRYQNKYPDYIRTVHKKNEGLLCTRRKGFVLAKGEYIVNCDSDDVLADDALIILQRVIEEEHPDVLIYNMGTYNGIDKNAYYSNCFTENDYVKLTMEQVLESYFIDDVPVVTSMAGKAIKKTCIDVEKDYNDFFGNSFGEDTLQSAEVYSIAKDIIYINKVLYYYRMETGMSSKFEPNYYKNFYKIIKSVSNYPYIRENCNYQKWMNVKILKSLGRSITQSKNKKGMSIKERKEYLKALYNEEGVKHALEELRFYRKMISKKYMILLIAFKYKFFLFLHVILSI